MSTNAQAPASGAPVARVVDAKNPRTQEEDTERIFQWIGRSREASNEEMIAYTKLKFTFTTKDGHGWYWFRKPWHPIDARCDVRNPRSLAEDHNQQFQWSCTAPTTSEEWDYCGPDIEGVRWYRRQWPVKDVSNPLCPADDVQHRYHWSWTNVNGPTNNREMMRDGWDFASTQTRGPGGGGNVWRKRRRAEEESDTEHDESAPPPLGAGPAAPAAPAAAAPAAAPSANPEGSRTERARQVIAAERARQRASETSDDDHEMVEDANALRQANRARDAMQELARIRERRLSAAADRERRLSEAADRERSRAERLRARGRALAAQEPLADAEEEAVEAVEMAPPSFD